MAPASYAPRVAACRGGKTMARPMAPKGTDMTFTDVGELDTEHHDDTPAPVTPAVHVCGVSWCAREARRVVRRSNPERLFVLCDWHAELMLHPPR